MSSIVCQGQQSCLKPRLVEPGALGLKMVATKPNFLRTFTWATRPSPTLDSDSYYNKPDIENNNNDITFNNICDNDKKKDIINKNTNSDLGGWSSIQALNNSNNSANLSMEVTRNEKKETLYVHPFTRRKLSDKSLEFCTENLGCETGSTTSEDSDISFPSSPSSSCSSFSDYERSESLTTERASKHVSWRRTANYKSFPPPLSSISGSNRVNISPHREGGRLIMKAAVVPSCHTYFQAERRDGRLILRFPDNSSSSSSSSTSSSFDSEATITKDVENKTEVPEEEEEEEEEEQEQEDDEVDCGDGDVDGNMFNVGGEIGMTKFPRRGRCMEGGKNKGLLIPHWVATS